VDEYPLPFITGANMAILDTPNTFGPGLIALHWLSAMRIQETGMESKSVVQGHLTLTFLRRQVLHPVDLNGIPPMIQTVETGHPNPINSCQQAKDIAQLIPVAVSLTP